MAKNPLISQRILEAASRIFYDKGYNQTSMDDIAREAGVSKATLYSHFNNKETLFRHAVREASEGFVMAMDQVALNPLPIASALREVGRFYLRFLLCPNNLAVVRAVIAQSIQQPELGQHFYEAGPMIGLAGVERFLNNRIACGDLPAGDAYAGARHFVALLRGDIHWRALLGIDIDPDAVEPHVDAAVEQFLSGFQRSQRD